MILEQKKKLIEASPHYLIDGHTIWIRGSGDKILNLDEWNPLDHFDDILRGLSREEKISLELKATELDSVLEADVYLWFRDNKEKVLELILEVLESEVGSE